MFPRASDCLILRILLVSATASRYIQNKILLRSLRAEKYAIVSYLYHQMVTIYNSNAIKITMSQ